MSEADILAMTYSDLCGIYRPFKKKLETGETVQYKGIEGELIATTVPCALSKHTGGKLNRGGGVYTAPTEYTLFTRPEVDIRAGDFLVVTHLGRTAAYYAGEADRQPSHNNIPVQLAKDGA